MARGRSFTKGNDMTKAVVNKRTSGYLKKCEKENKMPHIAGLAMALGYPDRRTMLSMARLKNVEEGEAVSAAILQVESILEDHIVAQSVGARWILSTLPDYEQVKLPDYEQGTIKVDIVEDEDDILYGLEPLPLDDDDSE